MSRACCESADRSSAYSPGQNDGSAVAGGAAATMIPRHGRLTRRTPIHGGRARPRGVHGWPQPSGPRVACSAGARTHLWLCRRFITSSARIPRGASPDRLDARCPCCDRDAGCFDLGAASWLGSAKGVNTSGSRPSLEAHVEPAMRTLVIIVSVLAGACVTTGTYDRKVAELTKLREADATAGKLREDAQAAELEKAQKSYA